MPLHIPLLALLLPLLCALSALSFPANAANRLTARDFTYLGAFRLPGDEPRPRTFEYGGNAMTFNPSGDPGNTDACPGSLFVMGHDRIAYGDLPNGNQVAEISIPAPVISRNLDDLPYATFIQNFQEVVADHFHDLEEIPKVGLAYLNHPATGPKIHLTWGQHLQPDNAPSQGWFNPTLATPDFQGIWFIGNQNLYSVNGYLFEIPGAWADANAQGRYLATGRMRDGGQGGMGPALFAYRPWLSDGSAPPSGTRLAETPLLLYENAYNTDQIVRAMNGYQHPDEWEGGAWITTTSGKSAVLFAGTKSNGAKYWYGYRNARGPDYPCVDQHVTDFVTCRMANGAACPAEDFTGCCDEGAGDCLSYRGWWSTRFDAQLILYDPDDLAQVASGALEAWQPQPYAAIDIDEHLYLNPPEWDVLTVGSGDQRRYRLGDVAYDRAHDLLYVLEQLADGGKPVVHVWRVGGLAATLFEPGVADTISWFYAAAFARTPVPNSALSNYGDLAGLTYWTNQYLGGPGAQAQFIGQVYAIADFFVLFSEEFQTQYPASLTPEEFVTALYNNMLGRAPDDRGLAFWVNELTRGKSRGTVLADFTFTTENRNANPLRQQALASFITFITADDDKTITPEEAEIWLVAHPDLDGAVVDGNPGPVLGACPIFPRDHIWNVPIDQLPLDARSSAYIASIGADVGLHPDFGSETWDGGPIGIPWNLVSGAQPKVSIQFDYADESDPGPYPVPSNPAIEYGSDHHLLIIDQDQCILYETWDTRQEANGDWSAGSGAIFDLQSHALRPVTWTSADAAGLPIFPGLARCEEIATGEIRHALRFTAARTQQNFVWPARHYASSITDPNVPPMGQRFRLKASFDLSGYSAQTRIILKALQTYGMFLADNGSNWYISGAPGACWDDETLVTELRTMTGSNFEAVDQSSLMIHPDSGQAKTQTAPTLARIGVAGELPAVGNRDGGPRSSK